MQQKMYYLTGDAFCWIVQIWPVKTNELVLITDPRHTQRLQFYSKISLLVTVF